MSTPGASRVGRCRHGARVLRALRDATGSATVEFAMVMPSLIVVVAFVVASLAVTSQSVRLADAAAVVARQTARGDGRSVADTLARLAPGARVTRSDESDLVCVDLRRDVRVGPVDAAITVSASSCAPRAGR